MSITQRQCVRIAHAIRTHLLEHEQHRWSMSQGRIGSIEEHFQRLQSLRRKLVICEMRCWYAAARKILGRMDTLLRELPYLVQQAHRSVEFCHMKVPSAAEIYRELRQAEDEFGELNWYEEGQLLAATTEPIELQDVFLGDFEIQLLIPSLAHMQYGRVYRIVALDAHPASSSPHVTHPHVSDEQLCAGDAGAAIHQALLGGRICDFFLLSRSVLLHYNPDSPYVALDSERGLR